MEVRRCMGGGEEEQGDHCLFATSSSQFLSLPSSNKSQLTFAILTYNILNFSLFVNIKS